MSLCSLLAALTMAQTSELGAAVSFGDLVKLLVFLTAVWIAGRIAEALRAPAVIGFVLAGACLGPPLAHYAPQPAALELLGELGLVILTVR